MEWSKLYDQSNQPTFDQIKAFINNDMWEDINVFLQATYDIKPKMTYSNCSAQRGWNIKYQKGGKSLCTLYPMSGYFIALVVIGNKEVVQTELLIPLCSDYTKTLYHQTPFSAGGRWLMMNVTNMKILDDVKNLIKIRVKPKNT